MSDITSIRVNLQTMRASGAGTDGDVYIGVGGREFYLDTSADDFESGSSRSYVLGDGSNSTQPAFNDPGAPPLRTEHLPHFPAYLRFQPQNRSDNWFVQRVAVFVNDSVVPVFDSAGTLSIRGGIWLGTRAGQVLHLMPHAH